MNFPPVLPADLSLYNFVYQFRSGLAIIYCTHRFFLFSPQMRFFFLSARCLITVSQRWRDTRGWVNEVGDGADGPAAAEAQSQMNCSRDNPITVVRPESRQTSQAMVCNVTFGIFTTPLRKINNRGHCLVSAIRILRVVYVHIIFKWENRNPNPLPRKETKKKIKKDGR